MYPPSGRNQSDDAQKLYDSRSSNYDKSWHVRFARHMVELAQLRPGEQVLDLACGTGLVSFPAAQAVGSSGSVTGIDISCGMLAEARKKLSTISSSVSAAENIEFFQHSISDLQSLERLRSRGSASFDAIICASALVLFEQPAEVVKGWVEFLKPGGRLIVDVTHPDTFVPGITMEKVGRALGRPLPHYRLNFSTPRDLSSVLEQAGLVDVEVLFVSQTCDQKTDDLSDYLCELENPVVCAEHGVEDADVVFEAVIKQTASEELTQSPELRQRAKQGFKDEWARIASADGKVREVDMVFVGIGKKRA